jgi:adenylylsulfate kinase-like enzyme
MRARNTSGGEAMVWWITGLSGAGKSTVSRLVRDGLQARGGAALLLDGDVMRDILGETLTHAPDDRRRLGLTYGRFAREVAGQGIDVICATISMSHAVREWNRAHIPRYREIYLRVPLSELERRDPQGLYAIARGGGGQVVGADGAFEEPQCPDLVIDNFAGVNPAAAAARILGLVAA